jgi:hypothetical protein
MSMLRPARPGSAHLTRSPPVYAALQQNLLRTCIDQRLEVRPLCVGVFFQRAKQDRSRSLNPGDWSTDLRSTPPKDDFRNFGLWPIPVRKTINYLNGTPPEEASPNNSP